MRDDLNEIIRLQEELLEGEESAPKDSGPLNGMPASSLASEKKKIQWKVGDRCLAPSKNGQHYPAVIDGISQDKVAISFSSKHSIFLK